MSRSTYQSAYDCASHLIDNTPILLAGGEFLAAHFSAQERSRGVPEEGHARRPQIGLRLEAGEGRTLTCKPGWTPPRWGFERGVRVLHAPGVVHADRVEVELVTPGIALRLRITEDG
ncbi:MAG TPA: hypothetical protein VGE74_00960, partial [Gemmata sp.]